MCGGPLQILPEEHVIGVSHPDAVTQASWKNPESALNANSLDSAIEPERSFDAVRNPEIVESAWRLRENDVPSFARAGARSLSLPALRRASARGSSSSFDLHGVARNGVLRQSAVPAFKDHACGTTGAANRRAADDEGGSPVPVEKVEKPVEKNESPPAPPVQNEKQLESSAQTQQTAASSAARIAPVASSSHLRRGPDSGNEQLATAEKYCSATGPQQWRSGAMAVESPWAKEILRQRLLFPICICAETAFLRAATKRVYCWMRPRKGVKVAGEPWRNTASFWLSLKVGCRESPCSRPVSRYEG